MTARWRQVRTQAELAAVVDAGDFADIIGDGQFTASGSATVWASGSATVTASGSATVRAYDSATVRAYDSATVRASGSATVSASGSATVTAYGSATVTAYGSATVRASGSATVTASGYVAVHNHGPRTRITGGVLIEPPDLTVTANWLAYYGLTPVRGIVTLYKSVNADWTSRYHADYSPGAKPTAPDWTPTNECGGGLHFSPRPHMALEYHDAKGQRFVACPVRVKDIVVIGSPGAANKCKAPAVVGKGCWPCDIDGEPVSA